MNRVFRVLTVLLFALTSSMAFAEPVDINTANAEQISEAMVGVGKVKAAAIIHDREQNGQFKSVDDLARVKGIKSSIIDKNRDRITVGQITQPAEPIKK